MVVDVQRGHAAPTGPHSRNGLQPLLVYDCRLREHYPSYPVSGSDADGYNGALIRPEGGPLAFDKDSGWLHWWTAVMLGQGRKRCC